MSLLDKASLIVTPNGYKASKLYSVVPSDASGDLSVTRATTATRVNSSGLVESVATNVPRIDYSNGSCPSLLVEPQSTNLCTYSNTFNNASYNYQNASYYATPIVSPDGTSNGYGILANTSTNLPHRWYKTFVGLTGIKTTTIYANKGTSKYLGIGFNSNGSTGNNNIVVYNLENGTIATNPNSINATITSVGNGWYRCQHTFDFGTGGTTADLCVHNAGVYNTYVTSSFQVNDFPTVATILYIYGVQVESVAYPTSYIPTVASSVTRNADVISKTGISSLIGQSVGTIFADFKFYDVSDSIVFNLVNTNWYTGASMFLQTNTGGNFQITGFNNSNNIIGFDTGIPAVKNQQYKCALVYNNTTVKLFINGTLITTNTISTSVVANNLFLSLLDTGIDKYGQKYNSVQLYKTALTDTECINLTTL